MINDVSLFNFGLFLNYIVMNRIRDTAKYWINYYDRC
jgi:hypothetical protein